MRRFLNLICLLILVQDSLYTEECHHWLSISIMHREYQKDGLWWYLDLFFQASRRVFIRFYFKILHCRRAMCGTLQLHMVSSPKNVHYITLFFNHRVMSHTVVVIQIYTKDMMNVYKNINVNNNGYVLCRYLSQVAFSATWEPPESECWLNTPKQVQEGSTDT